jgi:F-type H+-transporting ATPase subunit a
MEHHAYTWLSGFSLYEPIATGVLVAFVLIAFAMLVSARLRDPHAALEPEDGVTVRNVAEALVEGVSNLAEGIIGHHSHQYVPLLATFLAFILLANLLGLVPGVSPPTAHFHVTFGLGLVSFFAYHAYGLKAQGGKNYLKHFLGPIWWLAWLMLPIEMVSHLFRPITLGVRLYANMFADHTVIEIFTGLTHLVIPVIFYAFGALVCVIQAFVFTMLSAIYISLAVSHDH